MRKVALVTGAARGVGRAIVQDLAEDHDIALTWLTTEPRHAPPGALTIRADLTDPDAPARVIAAVIDRFGRLDVIVNNAARGAPSPLDSFDMARTRISYEVNVLAPQALLVAALPHLAEGAAIVNISSVNAAIPPQGAVHYGASKAALEIWTRGMAGELGPRGIRVNAVAPGAVRVPDSPRTKEVEAMFLAETALGKLPTGEAIARAVRFLAGEDAAYITGQVLTVSAGFRL